MIGNYDRFPENIYPPEPIIIDDGHYVLYRSRFNDLYSLYNYLEGNPRINSRIFEELHSVKGSEGFAGKPYEKAVEDLIADVDESYKTFLQFQKELVNSHKRNFTKFRTVKTVTGGRIHVPSYSAGVPLSNSSNSNILPSLTAK